MTGSAYAIVTGGGTAGHVLPALAIADALVDAGHPREAIHYAGAERGIEARLVPPTGYPLTLMPLRGFQRRLSVANLSAIVDLLRSMVRAVQLLGRLRPSVVIAVGGYASGAVGLAAVLRRIPIVVAEQNLVPGAANRLLARFAKVSAVSFPATELPRAVTTGNPIREEISSLDPDRDRAAAKRAFGVPDDRPLVLVFGGSLGALRINEAAVEAARTWRDRSDLTLHHVVGRRDWDAISAMPVPDGRLHRRLVPYEDDMPAALAAADVAVCRSGSSTCFELAAAALPAVLVPSPYVTADQQTGNARHLVDGGAAVLVPDAELDGTRLVAEVDELLSDPDRRARMAAAARSSRGPTPPRPSPPSPSSTPVADEPLDLTATRRLHLTNVGGAGMSAIATLLLEMGHRVSGHEPAADTPFLASLRALGAEIATGEPGPLPEVDAVVVSTATPDDHPHVVAARGAGIPVRHRAAALAAIGRSRSTVAVAGTHGKTTTSALLATLLTAAGREPGYIVGAEVAGLGRNAAWGGAGPLVAEADESDGSFLALGARSAIVTNVEPDHLEHWGGEPELRAAFESFVAALEGPAVLCLDDPGAAALVEHAGHPVTYGTSEGADFRIDDVDTEGTGVRFRLQHGGEAVAVTVPAAPGIHNARNSAAAMALAHTLGVGLEDAAEALAGFRGVARRFEVRGEAAGVVLVDSYDHLPTEVAAALAAARAGRWGRVVCCFQPHRYSRTEALGRSFADCFADADLLAVTEIYPAGEAPRPGVTGKIVVDAVLDAHPWKHVAWLPSLDDAVGYLGNVLRPGDLCLTLGAGDLTTIPPRVLSVLEGRRP